MLTLGEFLIYIYTSSLEKVMIRHLPTSPANILLTRASIQNTNEIIKPWQR